MALKDLPNSIRVEEDPDGKGIKIETVGSQKDLLLLWVVLSLDLAKKLNAPRKALAATLATLPPNLADALIGHSDWHIHMNLPRREKGDHT